MPEVFISNYNKQQRNYVQYKRQKTQDWQTTQSTKDRQTDVLPKEQRVPVGSLLLVVRIK